jgi:hypothetical protein
LKEERNWKPRDSGSLKEEKNLKLIQGFWLTEGREEI